MMAVDVPNRDQLQPPLLQLQSQFFTDESISINKPITKNYSSCFSSSGFGSIFSSPVESEQGSTESESDQDDDYIAELTRKMAHYMLQDDDNNNRHEEEEEWPKLGTKYKFENSHKKEENTDDDGCLSQKSTTPNLDFHSKKALIDEQIRTIQLYKLKQEQFMKQQQHIEVNRQFNRSKGQKGSWPNLQQQHRSGSEMRAVFLGESGSKAGSCGTGVFLPRGITNPTDSRKKTGCSTVLIPARVVQALKLQYDRMGIESRYITGATFVNQIDGTMGNMKYGHQQSEKKGQSQTTVPVPVPAMNSKELGLPQEWTY